MKSKTWVRKTFEIECSKTILRRENMKFYFTGWDWISQLHRLRVIQAGFCYHWRLHCDVRTFCWSLHTVDDWNPFFSEIWPDRRRKFHLTCFQLQWIVAWHRSSSWRTTRRCWAGGIVLELTCFCHPGQVLGPRRLRSSTWWSCSQSSLLRWEYSCRPTVRSPHSCCGWCTWISQTLQWLLSLSLCHWCLPGQCAKSLESGPFQLRRNDVQVGQSRLIWLDLCVRRISRCRILCRYSIVDMFCLCWLITEDCSASDGTWSHWLQDMWLSELFHLSVSQDRSSPAKQPECDQTSQRMPELDESKMSSSRSCRIRHGKISILILSPADPCCCQCTCKEL